MRTFAEFHDSRVKAISQHGNEVAIEFPHMYLYLFEGEPFQEPGAGYSQMGRLVFWGVQSVEVPELPNEGKDDSNYVWEGSIWVNGHQLNGVFEVPLEVQSTRIDAEIRFNQGQVFKVSCSGVSYSGLSDPRFIERYRT
ncbi:MAG TPA: hypothetical protein VNV60_00065 [Holophagaceae bacterium]|jgi:hypothetical protein|nr:hypothetical protein [Holophagaceae bacterium]